MTAPYSDMWFSVTCPRHGTKRLRFHSALFLSCWELTCEERVTSEPWPEEGYDARTTGLCN